MSTVTIEQAVVEQGRATAWNKQGNRKWEAFWLTDVAGVEYGKPAGRRQVTLTVSHYNGWFTVVGAIDTAFDGYTTTAIFEDPSVTYIREKARFSQKHLKELFEGALVAFDAPVFYDAYEIAKYR